jgi:hypothetical protein
MYYSPLPVFGGLTDSSSDVESYDRDTPVQARGAERIA